MGLQEHIDLGNAMRGIDATRESGGGFLHNNKLGSAERAYLELKRRILDNDMPAGSQHLEQELAALLAMSRTPVREAAVRLAQEGMVEIRPRHGIRVLPLSIKDMEEIYAVLTELEPCAARVVAERGLGVAELKALEAAIDDMYTALQLNDLQAWARADETFHLELIRQSGNKRLFHVIVMFLDQAHRARMATLRIRPKPSSSNDDHRAVVEAIRRRDSEAAYRIHRDHRIASGKLLVSLLKEFGLRQV